MRIQRKLGRKRGTGVREGLTRAQAERELRRLIDSERAVPRSDLTIESAGDLYLEHLTHVLERKPSTVGDYRSYLRAHLIPFFGERPLERIDPDRVRSYMAAKKSAGLSTKTVLNQLTFLHGLFAHAVKRNWVAINPVTSVDRPRASTGDPDIRYLELSELEDLLGAVPDDLIGATDRAVFLTAAMTGIRQGELIALRWTDVDWSAQRIRVRWNFTRQEFGTPKSKRSSRSVPMAERVAAALTSHRERTAYREDEDLVFCHPETGQPLDASKLRKRFKQALRAGKVRAVRFHDLRHTFGTHCAAAGVPLRTLQEWLGHRDFKTTLIYADYAPSPREASLIEKAFSGDP